MRNAFRVAILITATAAGARAFAQAQFAVDALVSVAVAKRLAADEDLKNFTYIEERRWSFIDRRGRTPERHETYEYTHVAADQYLKMVERDGKQLSGSDARHEEKRYSEALKRDKGFDLPQRAEHGEKYVTVQDGVDDVPKKYWHNFIRKSSLNGVTVWVIQCEPRAHSGDTTTFTLWIDPAGENILRYEFAIHEDSGEILEGSTGLEEFADEHGVMLPTRVQHHLRTLPGGNEVIITDEEHTFRNYKRFQSTVRILKPGEIAPETKAGDAK